MSYNHNIYVTDSATKLSGLALRNELERFSFGMYFFNLTTAGADIYSGILSF